MPVLSTIMPRSLWEALAARYSYRLPVYPVTEVYIHHGAAFAPLDLKDADGDGIPDNEEAIARGYQRHHMLTRGWSDVAYNFMVGQSGTVLRGRGWRNQGGATGNRKDRHSLSICAIGNFQTQQPTEKMIDAIVLWIITGIELGHIRPDAKIYGHRDSYQTACPGGNLYARLPEIRSRVSDRRVSTEEIVEGPISSWYEHLREAPDGTKDEAVRLWQYLLWLQEELDITEIDGVKGPATRAAHKRFEEKTYPGADNNNGRPGQYSWGRLLAGPVPEVETVTVTDVVEVLPAGISTALDAAHAELSKARFIANAAKRS